MGKIKAEDFKIANRIDMGSKGKFNANADMEPQLAEKLNDMKNGDKEFNRLVRRGAITLITPDDEPEVQESSESEGEGKSEPEDETEETSEEESTDEESEDDDDELTFEATGEYFAEHYGGGNFYIVDPNGAVLETAKGNDKATARVEELNENLEE